jgi:23S rRNA (guanosine2251-2'-O)-methyltransferase
MEKKIKQITAGRRNVIELLKKYQKANHYPIKEILVKDQLQGEIKRELSHLLSDKVPIKVVSGKQLDDMFDALNHQGVVCIGEEKTKQDFSDLKVFLANSVQGAFLVVDRIQDVGNLGNLLRTAECLGFQNVIISERESAGVNESVERISSGALHYLNVFSVPNLAQCIDLLKECGYWIVASTDKGSEDWSNLPENQSIVLIVGNEKEGVKKLLLDKSDFQLSIKMHGHISSLNVTSASAILMDRIMNR